jgi:hypothetical protein
MNNHQIEVREYSEAGYAPVVDHQSWRVAILNYIDELEPAKIDNFHCHLETDEVFVLLVGRCILFSAEVDEHGVIRHVHSVDMKPGKIYNVKKGLYHTHTLTRRARVLVVENRNTNDENSPRIPVDENTQNMLQLITDELWA